MKKALRGNAFHNWNSHTGVEVEVPVCRSSLPFQFVLARLPLLWWCWPLVISCNWQVHNSDDLCGQHQTTLRGLWCILMLCCVTLVSHVSSHSSFFVCGPTELCIEKEQHKFDPLCNAMQLGDQRWERNRMDIAKPRLPTAWSYWKNIEIGWGMRIISLFSHSHLYSDFEFDVELLGHCSNSWGREHSDAARTAPMLKSPQPGETPGPRGSVL